MGLLDRFLESDDSAAEKLDRLRTRERDLNADLNDAKERLSALESAIAEATAAGAEDRIEDGREERSELREEIDDLTIALEVVGEKIDELKPALLRERLNDLASEYELEYSRAKDELDRIEGNLGDALDAVVSYLRHLDVAAGASGEMTAIRDRLCDVGQEVELPVDTANTDRRLLDGRPRFVQYAVEELPHGIIVEAFLSEED